MKSHIKAIILVAFVAYAAWYLFAPIEETETYTVVEVNDTITETEQEIVPEPEPELVEETQIQEAVEQVPDNPFDDLPYEYDIRGEDFRVVCKESCRVSKIKAERAFDRIEEAVELLRDATGHDIHPSLLPFEVHVSNDDFCTLHYAGELRTIAYFSTFYDDNGRFRGLLCFDFDHYDVDKILITHEITHVFQAGRFPIRTSSNILVTEGFADIVSSLVLENNQVDSFCWSGNDKFGKFSRYPINLGYEDGRQMYFELCDRYGFDIDNVEELFARLESLPELASTEEFIQTLSNVVGEDTSQTFRNHGII